jgi:hypothetical protein
MRKNVIDVGIVIQALANPLTIPYCVFVAKATS